LKKAGLNKDMGRCRQDGGYRLKPAGSRVVEARKVKVVVTASVLSDNRPFRRAAVAIFIPGI
jgi:hypothetical protein